ncbi:hypothetical protein RA086_09470 [Lactiplantibacillus sp. WILCCON 0030]|uniref:Uncharacterized protein n=1 Tax=Lactiplantibacillus brownii TaxID=3069269 RepID=A0ABU1ABN3_9LACO|nr:hypothetical protein [Lactiplantibacillus brownii]MDQ7937837.1 hypothetical protein [Lactiplantibacillus brownii]
MAINSDSIYNVMFYIVHHPAEITFTTPNYTNVVRMAIPDRIKVANPEIYFPNDKLLVNRFEDEFVAKNGSLLDFFFDYTEKKVPNYHEVWVSTAHLPSQKMYFLELSFE